SMTIPKPDCPSLIRSLRIYHDGLLSVDSRHAFKSLPSRNLSVVRCQARNKRNNRDSLHPPANHLHRITTNQSSQASGRNPVSNGLSFLEKQFLEALQIRPQST